VLSARRARSLAGVLGIGDHAQGRACGDRGTRGLGHTSLRRFLGG
jgi:hypothetical protein